MQKTFPANTENTRVKSKDLENSPSNEEESGTDKTPTRPINGERGATSATEFSSTDPKTVDSTDSNTESALEPDFEEEVALKTNQCPYCKRINGDNAEKLGEPTRQHCNGVWNGVPYQVIERQQIRCEHCYLIHIVKKYL
jgi:phage FluMu protein Com